jgi:hypothetical protein
MADILSFISESLIKNGTDSKEKVSINTAKLVTSWFFGTPKAMKEEVAKLITAIFEKKFSMESFADDYPILSANPTLSDNLDGVIGYITNNESEVLDMFQLFKNNSKNE